MKIFLSWSGERSRRVAELLDDWLQCVVQAANPWMSSKDIDRGALWFAEISDQLAGTGIGVICLTKENINKPWILFESGALAKGISTNRVCTLLIDLEPTDVENPLAQFNHSKPNKVGIWDLVRTINFALKEDALKEGILEKVFETYWPKFHSDFNSIIANTDESKVVEVRSENDILLEVLSSIRSMDRRMRTIENNERHIEREDSRSSVRNRPSANEAKEMIIRLIKDGLTNEAIFDILTEKRVPSHFIQRVIEEYLDVN